MQFPIVSILTAIALASNTVNAIPTNCFQSGTTLSEASLREVDDHLGNMCRVSYSTVHVPNQWLLSRFLTLELCTT